MRVSADRYGSITSTHSAFCADCAQGCRRLLGTDCRRATSRSRCATRSPTSRRHRRSTRASCLDVDDFRCARGVAIGCHAREQRRGRLLFPLRGQRPRDPAPVAADRTHVAHRRLVTHACLLPFVLTGPERGAASAVVTGESKNSRARCLLDTYLRRTAAAGGPVSCFPQTICALPRRDVAASEANVVVTHARSTWRSARRPWQRHISASTARDALPPSGD